MNLPNKLTLLRVFLIPFFLVCMYIKFPFHYLAALANFSAASITDALDGKIARSRNLVTNFGKFLDPLADKVLVLDHGRISQLGTPEELKNQPGLYQEINKIQALSTEEVQA